MDSYLDFGHQPLSSILYEKPDLDPPKFPMSFEYCSNCGHVQARNAIDPGYFYINYNRLRSKHLPNYIYELAKETFNFLGAPNDLILEIGSNDGMFLELLSEMGATNILGVEPALNCAKEAKSIRVPVIESYFNIECAQRIIDSFGTPSIIIARHVLEHIDDLDSFMSAIRLLATKNTSLIIEVPDLSWAIEKKDFTSFIDQHISYFTHGSLSYFLEKHGFSVCSLKNVPNTWSGSICCVSKLGTSILNNKRILAISTSDIFKSSMIDVLSNLTSLSNNSRLSLFGGYCRTANLINYLGGKNIIDCVVDDDSAKHGKYLPGYNNPIMPFDALLKRDVNECVICAVNFEDIILTKHSDYLTQGGIFRSFPDLVECTLLNSP